MADSLMRTTQLPSIISELRQFLVKWPEPSPLFEFRIGWSGNYEMLLREEFDKGISEPFEIVRQALASGRVLLAGRAGSAKTTVVYRLLKILLDKPDVMPVIVDLKSWRAPYYQEWAAAADDFALRLEFLFSRLATPNINLAVLDALSPDILRVIAIDGLNEVTPTVAQEIISVADEYVRRAAQAVVIVTDRLTRRSLSEPSRWRLCVLKPLSDEEIRTHLAAQPPKLEAFNRAQPAQQQLFRTPLFLNQLLNTNRPIGSLLTTEAELADFFENRLGLTSSEIAVASKAAFAVYESQRARTFPLEEFRTLAGNAIIEKLMPSALTIVENRLAYFSHHFYHDYLAARHMASDATTWSHTGFDVITFKAASFDALALVLQRIKNPAEADSFIRHLYDWNLYGTTSALAEAHYGGFVPVTDHTQTIVLAMMAEKRWDFMLSTAERAQDALSVFPADSTARQMLNLANLEDLMTYVSRVDFDSDQYRLWKSVFILRTRESVPDQLLSKIMADDSITGWTLANVLKRTVVTESRQRQLRSWGNSPTATPAALWRIAHALGAYPGSDNVHFLLRLLDSDSALWPRYGALRSLLEIAAKNANSGLRRDILSALTQRVPRLSEQHLLAEMQRALFVRDAPEDWSDLVLPLLNRIFETRVQEEERNDWRKAATEIVKRYGVEGRGQRTA